MTEQKTEESIVITPSIDPDELRNLVLQEKIRNNFKIKPENENNAYSYLSQLWRQFLSLPEKVSPEEVRERVQEFSLSFRQRVANVWVDPNLFPNENISFFKREELETILLDKTRKKVVITLDWSNNPLPYPWENPDFYILSLLLSEPGTPIFDFSSGLPALVLCNLKALNKFDNYLFSFLVALQSLEDLDNFNVIITNREITSMDPLMDSFVTYLTEAKPKQASKNTAPFPAFDVISFNNGDLTLLNSNFYHIDTRFSHSDSYIFRYDSKIANLSKAPDIDHLLLRPVSILQVATLDLRDKQKEFDDFIQGVISPREDQKTNYDFFTPEKAKTYLEEKTPTLLIGKTEEINEFFKQESSNQSKNSLPTPILRNQGIWSSGRKTQIFQNFWNVPTIPQVDSVSFNTTQMPFRFLPQTNISTKVSKSLDFISLWNFFTSLRFGIRPSLAKASTLFTQKYVSQNQPLLYIDRVSVLNTGAYVAYARKFVFSRIFPFSIGYVKKQNINSISANYFDFLEEMTKNKAIYYYNYLKENLFTENSKKILKEIFDENKKNNKDDEFTSEPLSIWMESVMSGILLQGIASDFYKLRDIYTNNMEKKISIEGIQKSKFGVFFNRLPSIKKTRILRELSSSDIPVDHLDHQAPLVYFLVKNNLSLSRLKKKKSQVIKEVFVKPPPKWILNSLLTENITENTSVALSIFREKKQKPYLLYWMIEKEPKIFSSLASNCLTIILISEKTWTASDPIKLIDENIKSASFVNPKIDTTEEEILDKNRSTALGFYRNLVPELIFNYKTIQKTVEKAFYYPSNLTFFTILQPTSNILPFIRYNALVYGALARMVLLPKEQFPDLSKYKDPENCLKLEKENVPFGEIFTESKSALYSTPTHNNTLDSYAFFRELASNPIDETTNTFKNPIKREYPARHYGKVNSPYPAFIYKSLAINQASFQFSQMSSHIFSRQEEINPNTPIPITPDSFVVLANSASIENYLTSFNNNPELSQITPELIESITNVLFKNIDRLDSSFLQSLYSEWYQSMVENGKEKAANAKWKDTCSQMTDLINDGLFTSSCKALGNAAYLYAHFTGLNILESWENFSSFIHQCHIWLKEAQKAERSLDPFLNRLMNQSGLKTSPVISTLRSPCLESHNLTVASLLVPNFGPYDAIAFTKAAMVISLFYGAEAPDMYMHSYPSISSVNHGETEINTIYNLYPEWNLKFDVNGEPFEIEQLTNAAELKSEGTYMKHCIATYHEKARMGRCILFKVVPLGKKVKEDNNQRFSFELENFPEAHPPPSVLRLGGWKMYQKRSFRNMDPDAAVAKKIDQLHNRWNNFHIELAHMHSITKKRIFSEGKSFSFFSFFIFLSLMETDLSVYIQRPRTGVVEAPKVFEKKILSYENPLQSAYDSLLPVIELIREDYSKKNKDFSLISINPDTITIDVQSDSSTDIESIAAEVLEGPIVST